MLLNSVMLLVYHKICCYVNLTWYHNTITHGIAKVQKWRIAGTCSIWGHSYVDFTVELHNPRSIILLEFLKSLI